MMYSCSEDQDKPNKVRSPPEPRWQKNASFKMYDCHTKIVDNCTTFSRALRELRLIGCKWCWQKYDGHHPAPICLVLMDDMYSRFACFLACLNTVATVSTVSIVRNDRFRFRCLQPCTHTVRCCFCVAR